MCVCMMAQDFVLALKVGLVRRPKWNIKPWIIVMFTMVRSSLPPKSVSTEHQGGSRAYHYFHVEGNWKGQCPLLHGKIKHHTAVHAPPMLCIVSEKTD